MAVTGFGTPKSRLPSSSENVAFFEDCLPPPTLNQSTMLPEDADEPAIQRPLEPLVAEVPALLHALASMLPKTPGRGGDGDWYVIDINIICFA